MSIILGILQKQNQVCESGRQKRSDKASVHLRKLLSLVTQFLLADANSAKFSIILFYFIFSFSKILCEQKFWITRFVMPFVPVLVLHVNLNLFMITMKNPEADTAACLLKE